MKNNQCHDCGLYFFQCRCKGRKGVPTRSSKMVNVKDMKRERYEKPIKDFDHDGVPDDIDGAIQRVNEAADEFFSDEHGI